MYSANFNGFIYTLLTADQIKYIKLKMWNYVNGNISREVQSHLYKTFMLTQSAEVPNTQVKVHIGTY